MKKNKNVPALLKALRKSYPDAHCALNYSNPFELLVATILSAQCTDERVNRVTPELFKKFNGPKAFARVSQPALEKEIRSTGFFRHKAKSIRATAEIVAGQYKGEVPRRMENLLDLPGVARKTANVVLGTAFGVAEGVVVDTHVTRLSERLGLSLEKTPGKIEKDLMESIPQENWIWLSHALITHGRRVCTARSPQCPRCPVRKFCANPET